MKRGRQGVVRAMILASLFACALWIGCGEGSDEVTESTPRGVFDGVSDDNLAASGIDIVDKHPDPGPVTYTEQDAMSQVQELTGGAEVIGRQLVRAMVKPPTPGGDYLVWAVRVNPETVAPYCGGCVEGPHYYIGNTEIDIAILFVDAQTGQQVASYQGAFGETLVAHPDSTQVPGQRSRVVLYGISPEELAKEGIELYGPGDGTQSPPVSRLQAIDIALALRNEAQVAQIELAEFVMQGAGPGIDKLVWAVAYLPEGITPEIYGVGAVNEEFLRENPDWKPGAPATTYAASFIDVQTGEEVYYATAAAIPFITPAPE